MPELIYNADDETETARLGTALAEALQPRTVVALIGTLGAGKTRLVQAVGQALGVPREQIVSPTFVLIHEHAGRIPRGLTDHKIFEMPLIRDWFIQLGIVDGTRENAAPSPDRWRSSPLRAGHGFSAVR